jgi:type I restriction enzyme S subunit
MALYKTLVKKISISTDKKTKQKEYLTQGKLPIIDQGHGLIGGYTDDISKQLSCNLPVIVFGDHTKAVKYINFPFGAGADGIKILESKEDINPLYLYYITIYLTYKIEDKGYARHYQYFEKKEVEVPLLEEQARIVTRIEELFSELDKAVETLQTTKAQLAVYRQAVLKEAFEGKWYYSDRHDLSTDLKFNEVKSSEIDTLGTLPIEWRYVYLSDLGDLSRGRSKHRPRNDKKLFENGKYPFFQTGDVKATKYNLVTCDKMYGEYGLEQSRLWPAGTLCITIAANIAETCFLGVDGCFPDSIVGFTANDSLVCSEYIRFFIEASKKRLWAFAPATAQKNINLATLENLIVPYCTMDEQRYIVEQIQSRLSACDNIEQTVDTALQQAEAMRQSILKQAFEGRRVYNE